MPERHKFTAHSTHLLGLLSLQDQQGQRVEEGEMQTEAKRREPKRNLHGSMKRHRQTGSVLKKWTKVK